jgi:hypothetical protein
LRFLGLVERIANLGDGGVSGRVLGTLLTWMAQRTVSAD